MMSMADETDAYFEVMERKNTRTVYNLPSRFGGG